MPRKRIHPQSSLAIIRAAFAKELQRRYRPQDAVDQTPRLMNVLFSRIVDEVRRTGRVHFPGFGVFMLRSRKARRIRNPVTKELQKLKKTWTIGFRAARDVKESL